MPFCIYVALQQTSRRAGACLRTLCYNGGTRARAAPITPETSNSDGTSPDERMPPTTVLPYEYNTRDNLFIPPGANFRAEFLETHGEYAHATNMVAILGKVSTQLRSAFFSLFSLSKKTASKCVRGGVLCVVSTVGGSRGQQRPTDTYYRDFFPPAFPVFGIFGTLYVSRYGGVQPRFVKFNRAQNRRKVKIHVPYTCKCLEKARRKSGFKTKIPPKKTWKLWKFWGEKTL